MNNDPTVGVIGAGSWGTALANLLAGKGERVMLWSYEQEVADSINREHRNTRYLPDIDLEPSLRATSDIEEAVGRVSTVVSVSPSHVTRGVLEGARPHLRDDVFILSATKGIEVESLMTMDEVIGDVLPAGIAGRAAYLSGPSFALEVGQRQPTAVTVAAERRESAERGQELFQTGYFRVYTTRDVRGVELGGSIKNVMAIASGVVEGLGLGHNSAAALITRGLAEMTRLGKALGADPLTFAGLAGMGDLILTCTGGLSRNRSVGVELGRGRSLDDILGGMVMVAEGVRTTKSTRALAHRVDVEMPIVEEVHALLFEGRSPREAIDNLMSRDPKPERWS
jgi:glycerol-3-phosphate dehydrogenase (NAD(P)+)